MTTYKWQIVEMYKNPYDKRNSKDPNTDYVYRLLNVETDWATSSGIEYSDVMLLMKYFKVRNVFELLLQTFTSEHEYASLALNLLLTQIRHNGAYIPPSAQDLRLRAGTALANFKVPDFSNVDEATVFNAFKEPWETGIINDHWLSAFKALIFGLSNGNVSLTEAELTDFSARYMGPALYMQLISRDKVQRVIMGPYSTPFQFDG